MENQEKFDLIENSSDTIRPLPSVVRSMQQSDDGRDIDLRTINKEANKLARQFDKGNKQILEDIKKQEREQKIQEHEKKVESIEKEVCTSKPIARLGILGFLAVPFILMGALLLWANLFEDYPSNLLGVLVVILAVASYAFGAYSFFKGIFRAISVKEKVLSIIFGLFMMAVSVLLIIYRAFAENYVVLGVGALGVCLDFIYLLTLFIRAKKTRYVPYKAVVSFITFVASVLFIVMSFISDVPLLNITTGAIALFAGTLDFSA